MVPTAAAFRAFEQAGWKDPDTVAGYHAHLACVTTQSIDALLDAANVGRGLRVLDVATGAGYVAAAAARRRAEPVGIDFSAAQIRMARAHYPGLRFGQADAEALPFAPETFDAVVNAFGMCHLPSPALALALAKALRVLQPGGRVAFSVWDALERTIGFGAVYAAVRAHGSMDVGLPAGPNFFLFSDPDTCCQALCGAGFVDPSFRQVPQMWRMDSPDKLFERVSRGTVRASATLRAQTASAQRAIRTALRETVAPSQRGGHFELPMPAIIAAAVKP